MLPKTRLPMRVTVSVVGVVVGLLSLVEWKALYGLDHPRPYKVSCVSCHKDAKTLRAISDKSNDPLYLVHTGDLTTRELNQLTSNPHPSTK